MRHECIYFFAIAAIAVLNPASTTMTNNNNIGSIVFPAAPKYKYIYQLGDSLSDTGNLAFLSSDCGAARFPYGQSIGGPTGRFSDGLLIIDFIARSFSLPELNPYLKPNASFDHGANFAVAGSTALDSSFLAQLGILTPPTNTPISVQLNWFKAHLNNTCGTPKGCAERLREALVWIGEIGGNDINYAILGGKSNEEIEAFIPSIVEAITKAVREVINLGAVEIVVPGDVPLGCWPVYLILYPSVDPHAYDEMGCLKRFNQISSSFNNYLKEALASLGSEFSHVRIVYVDYYAAFLTILGDAHTLGFDEMCLLKACCGTVERERYSNEVRMTCGLDGMVCSDPSKYINWDTMHLTQKAYRHISEVVLSDIVSTTSKDIW